MTTSIQALAEQIEEAMPADRPEVELTLANGARLRIQRTRRAGNFCKTCQGDLALGHHFSPQCPQLSIERDQENRARLAARNR